MELWDYNLWKAHVRGECYDLVGAAGASNVFLTIGSIYVMIWYQRGGLDGIDVRLFFLNVAAGCITQVVLNETGNWWPMEPLAPNRNTWFSDSPVYGPIFTPLYVLPLFRGLRDNWNAVERFPRMLEQILILVAISGVLSFAFSIVNWGSIWCISASAFIGIFDLHLVLDRLYPPSKAESAVIEENQQAVV